MSKLAGLLALFQDRRLFDKAPLPSGRHAGALCKYAGSHTRSVARSNYLPKETPAIRRRLEGSTQHAAGIGLV